jgi:hypothetical protein
MKPLLVGLFATASLLGIEIAAQAAGPGECGVSKFWKEGRCLDAAHLEHEPGVPIWHMRTKMNWDEYILKYGTWKA